MSHLTDDQIGELGAELERALQRLERSMKATDEAARPVELDQAAVGRLSRMDSLQSQGMAKKLQERERVKLDRIHAAYERMAEGTYGLCTRCGEEIPFGRLIVFPETGTCSSCGDGG